MNESQEGITISPRCSEVGYHNAEPSAEKK